MHLKQITLANIKGFVQGNFRKLLDDFADMAETYQKEQALWRLKQVEEKSPKCLKEDKCIHCGCQVSAKVWENRGCEHGCYPPMMPEEVWNNFKKENDI